MDLSLLFPLFILLLFIPIFLSGRKQRRQMQEMQQLQSDLQVGDIVVTTSGLRATVVDVSYEETVDLEIADDVITTWVRAAVREKVVATEETPATTAADEDGTLTTGTDEAPPSLVKDADSRGSGQN
ncbi:preprotein translocase subunit YajC [Pseudonocardia sp. KRD-184]|uniref:Preprotein translocase subunit YajC n=1 Tax=Pseudonocardia oceani TaxID=2792013 RepID=A0ABS6UJ77_9PSEU|nr:preprotein translocase subunit YajC [Pseudonocardia oceani]MBW0093931.1 preprotein translocase subunit YajC [Pseudonocardia oceani]MBW0097354.1 preprotein translocase subunit YajC [Pseudonocardia oceani]MBW0113301.1 preprotein translocase subunit YajC [Pseudonocardia oceani]MBW0122541.1 preprotein translocase subunit YajC [Pseudonocardia oceani]MBW0132293.1 preprotein translocase subunit YajC [Pseudonocardia oceani]